MTAIWQYAREHAKAIAGAVVGLASTWVVQHGINLPIGWEVVAVGLITSLIVGAVPNASPYSGGAAPTEPGQPGM